MNLKEKITYLENKYEDPDVMEICREILEKLRELERVKNELKETEKLLCFHVNLLYGFKKEKINNDTGITA
jgi:hypothetical protein